MKNERKIGGVSIPMPKITPNTQVPSNSDTYQPKQDVGRWLDFTITGDGTTKDFPLINGYLGLYRGYVINGVEIIQTAGAPNIGNAQSIKLTNRRIDGQDESQVTIIDLTKYKSDALSSDTKIIANNLRFPIDDGKGSFDSRPSLVFSTAPATTQSYLVRFYVERIIGKEYFI